MPKTSQRPKLMLVPEEMRQVVDLANSRTAHHRVVKRARILGHYLKGRTFTEIATLAHTSRRRVYQCVDRALAMGVETAVYDLPHGQKERTIHREDKAWVVQLACTQPKTLGYAAKMWTRRTLAEHIRKKAQSTGHPSLAHAGKATVQRILDEQRLKQHKAHYFLKRPGENFGTNLRRVLVIYRELSLESAQPVCSPEGQLMFTISVSERSGEHRKGGHDSENIRMDRATILTGLDLQDSQVIARVERYHRSPEFIAFLKDLDAYYPPGAVIQIILDDHPAHFSKETRSYLTTRPNRFCYVRRPTDGMWLDLVETMFEKMAQPFLRSLPAASWEDLSDRILLGISKINAVSTVHRWQRHHQLAGD